MGAQHSCSQSSPQCGRKESEESDEEAGIWVRLVRNENGSCSSSALLAGEYTGIGH